MTGDEEKRLRSALDKREKKIKIARENGNSWREERGYEKMTSLQTQAFADHLKPMVLLSLNTGLRRGELFNLTWKDFSLNQSLITIKGEYSKSGKTRYVPLNSEALDVLQA